uniref:PDZ domain-containing protein n=1 Tax=Rhabditophanes sp. KR3021 TaxID=114890 RepID=A0AC35TII2_9BILA
MSISSDHSSTTPDYHSPTHSEDSGFHNDNFNQALRTTVKATTNFAGQQQSKLLTSTTNRYKNISADTKSDMISEKADCYFKSRNCPSSIYGYMDCKMSKSSTTFLNKITIGPSKPIVPPKPKFFSQDNDANCLKSHRLFNRASEQNNLNETCKEDQLPCAEQLQSKPFATVSSLIQQFQSGNIHHHDDEETDYTKNNLDMFQTNAPSIEEVTIIDDYFVLKKSNSEQNNNNKEDQFYPTSDNRYKELVEKYREPSPLQSTISPALRSLIEKDRANISQEEKKTSKSSFPETKGSFIEIDSNVLTEDDLESFAEIEFGVETVPENETIYSVPIQKIESFQMPVMPDRLAKAEKRDFEKEITKDSSRINFDQNLIRKDSQMLHLIREDANKLNLIREDANKLNLIREDANKFNLIREDANKLNLIREDANKLNLDLIEEDSIEQNLDFSQQLITIKKLLQDKFEDYDIYNISMQRVANIIDGSVGIILTGAESTTSHSVITVQKVITGSVADREGTLAKGDSLFYIQGQSTSKMSAADARSALKAPAQVVSVVAGRFNSLKRFKMENQYNSINDTFAKDPNTCVYSNSIESVVLKKTAIGVGLSIDGGSDSLLGIRPIFVKRLFLGGEASKSNLISVGDIITSIETMSFQSITYLEAWKYLKTLPEGPITINIKKLQK